VLTDAIYLLLSLLAHPSIFFLFILHYRLFHPLHFCYTPQSQHIPGLYPRLPLQLRVGRVYLAASMGKPKVLLLGTIDQ
jgi:hypothetical protein